MSSNCVNRFKLKNTVRQTIPPADGYRRGAKRVGYVQRDTPDQFAGVTIQESNMHGACCFLDARIVLADFHKHFYVAGSDDNLYPHSQFYSQGGSSNSIVNFFCFTGIA